LASERRSIVRNVKNSQMNIASLKYVQVGKGRLGRVIANRVKQTAVFAKIDADLGLQIPAFSEQKYVIENLVICISPSTKNSWDWADILKGILQQVLIGQLKINRLIFISSTRVYEGIERGIVDATTQAISKTSKGVSLLAAEKIVAQIAQQYHILRCSGLYGEGYKKYLSILSQCKKEQTRFAVSIEQVADEVVGKLAQATSEPSSCTLLTDGYCYFQGDKMLIQEAMLLSLQHKIFKASCTEL